MSALDYSVFQALNSLAASKSLAWIFIFFAVYLYYLQVGTLIIYWFQAKDLIRARKAALMAAIAFIISRGILTTLFRIIWTRDRPFISHTVQQIIEKNNEGSFPSGHASAMFAIAMAIYMYDKKLGALFFVLAALTGVSRVIVGVHYPSDIIAGALLGIIAGYFVFKIFDKKIDRVVQYFSNLSDRIFSFTKAR